MICPQNLDTPPTPHNCRDAGRTPDGCGCQHHAAGTAKTKEEP